MSVQFTSSSTGINKRLNSINQNRMTQPQRTVVFRGDDNKENLPVPAGEKLAVAKSLAKGFVQPIKDIFNAIVQAPLPSAIILGVTAAAMRASKLFGALLSTGICAYGAFKIGSGSIKAAKAINEQKSLDQSERNYAAANKQISEIGEGIFDVALTANTAVKSAKSMINTGKAVLAAQGASMAQKAYGVIKLTESPTQIMQHPQTAGAMWQAFKQDGITEILKLKSILTGSRTGEVPEAINKMGELLNKAEPAKADVVKGLQDIAEMMKKDSATAKRIQSVLSQLQVEQLSKLNPEQVNQLKYILAGFESAEEIPAGMRVLRGVMESGNQVDDVATKITTRIKAFETGAKTSTRAALPNAEILGEDDR
ncbi:MAG: hypothetical protein AB1782_04970 [Cyanobacteriota bacterium]